MTKLIDYENETSFVKSEYINAEKKYKELISLYKLVVRWEYATNDLYSLEPYYFEKNRISKGRIVKDVSKKWSFKYGFDKDNKLIICNEMASFDRYYETFYTYNNSTIIRYYYSYDMEKPIIAVGEYKYKKGLLIQEAYWAQGGNYVCYYIYDDLNLKKVIEYRLNTTDCVKTRYYDYTFDDKGLLSISCEKNYIFYRLTKKEFNEILALSKDILVSLIIEKLSLINFNIKKCNLLIEDGFLFPPVVMLCSEKFYEEKGKDELLPCEYDLKLEYSFSNGLANKLNILSELSKSKNKKIIEMLVSAVSEINEKNGNIFVKISNYDGDPIYPL